MTTITQTNGTVVIINGTVDDSPIIPQTVTMRQARLALLKINKLSQVKSVILSLPSPLKEEAEITWEYSQEVQRSNGFIPQIATALGLSDLDLDNLFIEASKL